MRPAGWRPTWPRWRPRGDDGWGPTRTPTAAREVPLELPTFGDYAIAVPRPARERAESTRQLGRVHA